MEPQSEQSTSETAETETVTPETQAETSSPQSEAAESGGEIFQDVDFSELVATSESDGEEQTATPDAAPKEDASKGDTPSTQEDTSADAKKDEGKQEADATAEAPETSDAKKDEGKDEPNKKATPEPEPTKIPTKEELEGMYKEHREQTLPELEKLFTLTDDEAAALDEAPSKALPKMAAQMMYDTMMSSYNAVMAAMPSVVNRLITASSDAQTAEQQFFDAWPDLKGSEPVVATAVNAYRSANPRATREEVISNAGVMAMMQLGKDPAAARAARNGANGSQQPAPQQQQTRTAPPKPVAPTGQSPTPPPAPGSSGEDNLFAGLAEAFERDSK